MKSQKFDMKSKKMCQFKGVPPYHLPRWRYLPLQNKLPMLKKVPDGAVSLYLADGSIGSQPWVKNKNLDFDLWDPKMQQLPCDMEYDSLRDPYLKCYFSNTNRLKMLYRQGLVTRDGKTITSLKTYNKYRHYLHYMNIEILKTIQKQTECDDINKLVIKTMLRKKNEEMERMKDATECDDFPLTMRYSEALNQEVKGMCEKAEKDFKETSYFRQFPEGERESLVKLRELLLNQVKKKALVRLRKLQLYEDNQSTFWNEWLKHSQAEIQDRADELVKEQVYKYERCKHIAEYDQLTANRRANMSDAVFKARQEHMKKQTEMIRKVRENICKISHRQYPLSAICPYNFFEGGNWDTQCPYQEIVTTIQEQLYCEEKPHDDEEDEAGTGAPDKKESAQKSICAAKDTDEKDCRGKMVDKKINSCSVADRLVKEVIKNTLALTVKHFRLPFVCSKPKTSKFKTIRNTYFVQEMMAANKNELARLLKNNLEILKKLVKASNAMKSKEKKNSTKAPPQEVQEDENVWESAPLMRSNSNTMVGRYVREQLLQIATKLKNEGGTKNNKSQSSDTKREQKMQNAIAEVTMAKNLHEMACQLIDGKKMICQSLEIISIFEENEETDKCDRKQKDDLVYNLLTSLIINGLHMIKDSLACNAIETEDIFALCAIISSEDDISKDKLMCKEVERLIEEYSENLMKNRCMHMLIKDTAKQIRCTKENPRSDKEISKSILNATKKFVTKVVENIVAEVKVSKEEKESESEDSYDDEIICRENVSEVCEPKCEESEDECLEEEDPDEFSTIPNPDLSGSDHPNRDETPDEEDASTEVRELMPKEGTPRSQSDRPFTSQTPDSISRFPEESDATNRLMTPNTPDQMDEYIEDQEPEASLRENSEGTAVQGSDNTNKPLTPNTPDVVDDIFIEDVKTAEAPGVEEEKTEEEKAEEAVEEVKEEEAVEEAKEEKADGDAEAVAEGEGA